MVGRLEGKVAVITGAGSGMGEATAKAFCREGAKVIAADISGRQKKVAEEIGPNCVPFHVDVTKGVEIQAMLQEALKRFGKLDILYNNAGIEGAVAPTGEYSEEDFDHVWNVDGRAVFLGMRYAIPLMLAGGGGSIITTASIASVVAFPNMPAYCAAKGAVQMLTKTAAAEYGKQGIRVNAILPGTILTAMTSKISPELITEWINTTPLGRQGTATDIANLALFLASDESSFITGASVLIDGLWCKFLVIDNMGLTAAKGC
jgi:NAD(P)-dependent dehydrogenase (short-subunit alcohol dehydrogenase family)